MDKPIVEARNLSKVYRLGKIGMTSLRDEVARIFASEKHRKTGDFWALQDVSFEVARGEVLGIIGRNGAGKSTLLKILSRVTEPSSGSAVLRGRVASLLEVGTGFHQELSGRENVYLNGAILGMKRSEIRARFDEIVAFSEMEKQIDTPVKRYSSGQAVRLAFAVAAHLEAEILIVDEVLAVGDHYFQRKCLSKMQDVAGGGRTVLFVSHNLPVQLSLCQHGLFLNGGKVALAAPIREAVDAYLKFEKEEEGVPGGTRGEVGPEAKLVIDSVRVCTEDNVERDAFHSDEQIKLEITYRVLRPGVGYNVSFHLYHLEYGCIFTSCRMDDLGLNALDAECHAGKYRCMVSLPVEQLRGGDYYITVDAAIPRKEVLDRYERQISFRLVDTTSMESVLRENRPGSIFVKLPWTVETCEEWK